MGWNAEAVLGFGRDKPRPGVAAITPGRTEPAVAPGGACKQGHRIGARGDSTDQEIGPASIGIGTVSADSVAAAALAAIAAIAAEGVGVDRQIPDIEISAASRRAGRAQRAGLDEAASSGSTIAAIAAASRVANSAVAAGATGADCAKRDIAAPQRPTGGASVEKDVAAGSSATGTACAAGVGVNPGPAGPARSTGADGGISHGDHAADRRRVQAERDIDLTAPAEAAIAAQAACAAGGVGIDRQCGKGDVADKGDDVGLARGGVAAIAVRAGAAGRAGVDRTCSADRNCAAVIGVESGRDRARFVRCRNPRDGIATARAIAAGGAAVERQCTADRHRSRVRRDAGAAAECVPARAVFARSADGVRGERSVAADLHETAVRCINLGHSASGIGAGRRCERARVERDAALEGQ